MFALLDKDGATIVNINLMFRSISAISDNKMVSHSLLSSPKGFEFYWILRRRRRRRRLTCTEADAICSFPPAATCVCVHSKSNK